MKNRQDMTEEEHRVQDAREWTARVYRAEGFGAFAEDIERGERDDCHLMPMARFFLGPPQPHHPEFIDAWAEMSAVEERL